VIAFPPPRKSPRLILCLAIAVLVLGNGCSTSFHYSPQHNQSYAPSALQIGLAIRTGQDSRLPSEIQPDWAKNAEKFIAHAVADEVKYANLFRRVKIHADSVNLQKYSAVLQFRILKFECYNQAGLLESTGRDMLRFQGIRGALIAESIPTKYNSDVEVEFTLSDASTLQPIFVKTYAATRSVTLNGYQNAKPKVQQTSAALESVVTQFVSDLSKLPLPAH
jgi:hypothetical protein